MYAIEFIKIKDSAYFDGVDEFRTEEQREGIRNIAHGLITNAKCYASYIMSLYRTLEVTFTTSIQNSFFTYLKKTMCHNMLLQGLTNYLKWCADNIESSIM